MEKNENQKGERAIRPVISFPRKNGSEDRVLKGTKLITNTKKAKIKNLE